MPPMFRRIGKAFRSASRKGSSVQRALLCQLAVILGVGQMWVGCDVATIVQPPVSTDCGAFGGGCDLDTDLPDRVEYDIQFTAAGSFAPFGEGPEPPQPPGEASFGPDVGYPDPLSVAVHDAGVADRGCRAYRLPRRRAR